MKYDRATISNRLFIARNNKNLKQSEVCEIIGINQSSYSQYELGKRDIPLPSLFILSEYLDVSVEWLLGIGDNHNDFTDKELLEIEKFKRYIKSIRKPK